MNSYVFVHAIERDGSDIVVHASNGGLLMPEISFKLHSAATKSVYVGKRYKLTVEEADE